MIKRLLKNTDFWMIGAVIILFVIGTFAIYSANYSSEKGKIEYLKNIVWFAVGATIAIAIWAFDYNALGEISYIIIPIFLLLLVGLLFLPPISNARSWYKVGNFLFQPAETFKFFYILGMGKFIEFISNSNGEKNEINKLGNVFIILGCMLLVVGLIAVQPDFGTAFVYVIITFFMLFRAGISYKYVAAAVLIALILVPIVYFLVLSPVQQNRIKVFLDPTLDPTDSGYNAIQSKIAVGSGMFSGMGYLKGTQTQYGFLPVKSSDFIYSVISEELGFVFSAIVILLEGFILLRMIYISSVAKDFYGSIIVAGVTGMFFFHIFENIGMTMGIMPITGIPLPFVSYGGSSMLTNMMLLGLVSGVGARRENKFFVM